MGRHLLCFAWILFAGALQGCESKIYRAETVLESNGTVQRAIYQPTRDTPPAAMTGDLWQQTTHAARRPHEEWVGPIRSLPEMEPHKDRPYFAAWGSFPSPSQIPQTFLKKAPDGLSDGTLRLDYEKNDLVLVTEYRWNETLTDVVSIEDFHQAQSDLADLLIPLVEVTLNKALGRDYDTSGLVHWMHATATPIGREMLDVGLDQSMRGNVKDFGGFLAVMEPVLARNGLSLRGESGEQLSEKELQLHLNGFARRILSENLHRRDGKPVPEEVITEIVQWLGVEPLPEGEEVSSRMTEASLETIQEQFEGQEKLQLRLRSILVRLLGLYRSELVSADCDFDYSLTMPGEIVETSGDILSPNSTRWAFSATQAYPFGFEMKCRSIVVQDQLAAKLLDEGLFTDRARVLDYIDLVHEDELLVGIMRKCVEENSLIPLVQAREASAPGSDEQKRIDSMIRVLKPVANP